MSETIRAAIAAVIANDPVTCFLIGLSCAGAAIVRAPRVTREIVVEKLLAWHVFWSIGVCHLVNFVFHAAFGRMAAAYIGWTDSPFQFEVATASLGFAAVGFLAAWRSFDLRLAAIVGPGFFMLGAAVGHVVQMVTAHDFVPGNAGAMFYADIGVPLFGLALLWLSGRGAREAGVAPAAMRLSPTVAA